MKNTDKKKENEVSSRAMVEVAYTKFPWLAEVFDKDGVADISFYRISLDLMKHRVQYTTGKGFSQEIYVFDQTGTYVGQVGSKPIDRTDVPWWKVFLQKLFVNADDNFLFSEKIEDAVDRLANAHYLVSVMKEKKGIKLLFAAPKERMTIKQTVEDELKQATSAIEARLSELMAN